MGLPCRNGYGAARSIITPAYAQHMGSTEPSPSVAYSYGYRPCHRYQVEQNRLVSDPPVNERYSAVVLLLALPASGADTRLRDLK